MYFTTILLLASSVFALPKRESQAVDLNQLVFPTSYPPIPEWYKQSNIGFAFAGSAALLPYYLGVAYALVDSGAIVRGVTPIGGLSGGAVTGTLIHSMLPFESLYDGLLQTVEQCVKANPGNPCFQTLYPALVGGFYKMLPDDIHTKTVNKNILRVAVTKLDERYGSMNMSRPMIIGRVRSKDVLMRALGASTYIPCVSGPHPYTLFEGFPVIDGGYSAKYEHLCPEGVDICFKVGSYYIGPHTMVAPGESEGDCVKNEVNPGSMPVMAVSHPWRSAADLAPTAPQEKWNPQNITVPFDQFGFLPDTCSKLPDIPFAKPGQAEIYPGKYPQNPVPYSCKQWQDLSFKPTPQDFINMVNLGLKDAALWLQELNYASQDLHVSDKFR